jgi:hypothetical protein
LHAVRLERLLATLCLGADLLELGSRAQWGPAGDTVQRFSRAVILLDGPFQQTESWRSYRLSARQVCRGSCDEFWLWIAVSHYFSLCLCNDIGGAD